MPRTVSLLPSATDIVFAIGAGSQLVGRSHECDVPASSPPIAAVTSARISPEMPSARIDQSVRQQLENSASLYQLDLDLLRRLEPELVLTQQLCTVCAVGFESVRAAMRSLPHPPEIVNLEPNNLDDVLDSIATVGRLMNRTTAASELIGSLRSRLDAFSAVGSCEQHQRVLFLEWLEPPFCAGHWIPELIESAGGVPVLHRRGAYSRQLDWDVIENTAFDAVVVSCCGFTVERTLRDVEASVPLQRILTDRPAVALVVFDGTRYFSRPGPLLVDSAHYLAAALRNASADGFSIPDVLRVIRPAQPS